ncbi:MAG: methyltransferase domain-containing protein [Nanoarchaeota archaeon]|nr:methyltransferase domain-containing protein [Nanoarchaeota archaeon]
MVEKMAKKGNSENNLRENETFFDRWAKSYDRPLFQFWMRGFYQPALQQITKSGKVLDVSCGTGGFLRELQERVSDEKKGSTLYGADISSQMLAAASRKLGKIVHLQKADVHRLPFKDNHFDYVVSTEAFHHYANQRKALAEMKRVAKKQGKVLIVDINFFLRPLHWLFQKLEPGCVKINSRKEMRTLFQEAGLQHIMQQRSFLFAVLTQGVKMGG